MKLSCKTATLLALSLSALATPGDAKTVRGRKPSPTVRGLQANGATASITYVGSNPPPQQSVTRPVPNTWAASTGNSKMSGRTGNSAGGLVGIGGGLARGTGGSADGAVGVNNGVPFIPSQSCAVGQIIKYKPIDQEWTCLTPNAGNDTDRRRRNGNPDDFGGFRHLQEDRESSGDDDECRKPPTPPAEICETGAVAKYQPADCFYICMLDEEERN